MSYKNYQVYIITNKNHTVLYTGMTNNITRRIIEHQQKINQKSFSAQYNLNNLVWYENHNSAKDAIAREKQIKAGSRKKKIKLIEAINPNWKDLSLAFDEN